MFSDESDIEDINLTINEHYAKAYEFRKEREELAKLKEKYGSDLEQNGEDSEDSESLESEDEDGEELTPAMDAAILRTLARIKRKDPSIYQAGKDVFEEEKQRTGELQLGRQVPKDKSKPLTLRQHALASAIQDATGARSRSSSPSPPPGPEPLTHAEEQRRLRAETIAAFHAAADGLDDGDEFLVPREKTRDVLELEEEAYRAYLEREVGQDLANIITVEDGDDSGNGAGRSGREDGEAVNADGALPKKGRKKDKDKEKEKEKKVNASVKSGKSKQDADQEFLVNYILNRGWIDKSARRLPTYKEITSMGKRKGKTKEAGLSDASAPESGSEAEGGDVKKEEDNEGPLEEEDDEFDDIAEAFESSYNFRFEEPGAAEIARHPRNLPSLVRRQDTSRKEAREKRRARKEEELLKKKEEVNRLKALKLKELRAKLERIGAEGGKRLEESKALQELDLDAEWDPEAHDRQMRELYENEADASGFGAGEGGEVDVDEEKPTWDDDIDITDIVPHGVDSDDEDYGAGPSEKKKKKKKKKKKGGNEEAEGVDVDEMDADVERPPPRAEEEEEWDGTEEMRKRKLEEYMDEVYGLDFNDMVGGLPTRFRYAKVEPQHFGLTPVEILTATDAELNTYMGIKRYAPYRRGAEGRGPNWDAQRGARLKELREKLRERGAQAAARVGERPPMGEREREGKKRKGRKERMREKEKAGAGAGENDQLDESDESGNGRRAEEKEVSNAAEKAKKRKHAHDGESVDGTRANHDEAADVQDEEAARKKKRRRHRKAAAAAP